MVAGLRGVFRGHPGSPLRICGYMSDEEQQRGNPPRWFRVVYRYYYLGHLLVLDLIARTISLRSGDVMTSTCCVYAGSEAVLPFNGIRKCHHTSVRPSTLGQHLSEIAGTIYEAADLHYII